MSKADCEDSGSAPRALAASNKKPASFAGTKPFNNEPVTPKWILRRHDLFACAITLPNSTSARYDQYKVPCGLDCNTAIGHDVSSVGRQRIRGMFLETCRDSAISPSLGNERLTVVTRAFAVFRPGIAVCADHLDVTTKSVRVADKVNEKIMAP